MLQGTSATSLRSRRPVFDKLNEKKLADYVWELDNLFYGVTRQEVMRLVFKYARINNIENSFNTSKRKAGKKWFHNFCLRNNISLRTPEKLSASRAAGSNRTAVDRFFNNRSLYQKYNFTGNPCIIWMNLAS